MAANGWFLQFLADMTEVPVERPACAETTIAGAAFLAGLGSGVFGSLNDIKAAWSRDFRANPKISRATRESLLGGWRKAVARIAG